jgi:hypothetical protein
MKELVVLITRIVNALLVVWLDSEICFTRHETVTSFTALDGLSIERIQ